MAFGAGNAITTIAKAIWAQRVQTSAPAAGSVTPPAAGSAAPKNQAIGVGATTATRTAASTDTSLSQEVEARVVGTESIVTTSNTNDTYQVVATTTATSARAVDEAGVFDTANTTTAASQASAGATSLVLANSSIFQSTGTLYALNRTTPSNGAQSVAFSANNTGTNTLTTTALTGQINFGDRVVQGNLALSSTMLVVNLSTNDSLQLTWKCQFT